MSSATGSSPIPPTCCMPSSRAPSTRVMPTSWEPSPTRRSPGDTDRDRLDDRRRSHQRLGAIRDLSDPSSRVPDLRLQPDTMAGFNSDIDLKPGYLGVMVHSDNGGVHFNSGIPNKTAFLMTEGGVHNGVTVQGMGRDKMRNLKWIAMTHLPFLADFAIARDYELAMAEKWAQSHPAASPPRTSVPSAMPGLPSVWAPRTSIATASMTRPTRTMTPTTLRTMSTIAPGSPILLRATMTGTVRATPATSTTTTIAD